MKRSTVLACLGLAVVLGGCAGPAGNRTADRGASPAAGSADFFPVSVWYSGGRARAPMLSTVDQRSAEEWRRDLEQIKGLGFNTVRTWVEWAHCEPHQGVYDYKNLKLLARLADEVGLRFMIQLYVDSAPEWVGRTFPEGRYETQSGAKVDSQSAPGYCSDHPGVRQAMETFIQRTAQVAGGFPNFWGWDLWSEPLIVNWAYINYVPDVQFCYCPYTRARFRDWLKAKYSSLEALDRAWYRGFDKWDQVEPPRFGTILSYTDYIDWKGFIYDKLAGDLQLRYDAVRRADPSHVITSHAAIPSIFGSPDDGYGATDDFLMADRVDYYGTSVYPRHNHPSNDWPIWKLMVALDFERSANRSNGGFYVGELQAGEGTYGLNVGDPVTPQDHRRWMWSAVAKGARAINVYAYYPMSSGYESGGYGLVHLDGTLTERAVEAGKTARIIDANHELLLAAHPVPAQVALVYNPLSQMVGGEQRHGPAGMHQQSLFGYYRILADSNVPVDFIHRRDLETGNLDGYRLLILPYPLMLGREAAEGIRAFVAGGGHVLAEARLAWNDERGFAAERIPGLGLDEVFGAVESGVQMREEVAMTTTAASHPLLAGLAPGSVLRGAYFEESLEPRAGSVVLARTPSGAPAVVAAPYQGGETALIGSFLGLAAHRAPDATSRRFVLSALDWAGVERPFTTSHDGNVKHPVEVRLERSTDTSLLFVINHGAQAEDVAIHLGGATDGAHRVRFLVGDGGEEERSADGGVLHLEVRVPARDVRVLTVTPVQS